MLIVTSHVTWGRWRVNLVELHMQLFLQGDEF